MVSSVVVRVPATSANLGPGFDSLGLALALTQDVTVALGHQIETNNGLARLVLDAARSAYRLARVEVPASVMPYTFLPRVPRLLPEAARRWARNAASSPASTP